MNWFIKVRNMVYGPYTKERMARFAAEGRVSVQTQVSDNRDHGFKPAAQDPELIQILSGQEPEQSQPKSAMIETPGTQKKRFVLYTHISEDMSREFERNLNQFGTPIQPVAGVWVLNSIASSDKLRNVLSRCLGSKDSLLIFEINQEQAAWFNIGETADRQIREYLSTGV